MLLILHVGVQQFGSAKKKKKVISKDEFDCCVASLNIFSPCVQCVQINVLVTDLPVILSCIHVTTTVRLPTQLTFRCS